MIVLVDTDVLIDVALGRVPFVDNASSLLDAIEQGGARGFVAWHSISNFYYLVAASGSRTDARRFIDEITQFLDVAPATRDHLRRALRFPLKDVEDALQVGAATACAADFIVTRNIRDFRQSPIPALTPAQALAQMR